MLGSRWQVKQIATQCHPANSRVHLTCGSVTDPAEDHRRQDDHLGLPGPRRPQLAGDANVSEFDYLNGETASGGIILEPF